MKTYNIRTKKLKNFKLKDNVLDGIDVVYALDDIANRLKKDIFLANKRGLVQALSALVVGYAGTVHNSESSDCLDLDYEQNWNNFI